MQLRCCSSNRRNPRAVVTVSVMLLALTAVGLAGLAGCDRGNNHAKAKAGQGPSSPSSAMDQYTPDASVGREIFLQGCVTCHGSNAGGLPHQGADLRTSTFIATHSDKDLIEFIKNGRPANDPANRSGIAMPPDGNMPGLTDDRLSDLVAFLRQVQREAKQETAGNAPAAPGAAPIHP